MKYSGFGYYGYDRQTYENCGEQIYSTNRKHALMIELWFIVNNFLYVIFSLMGVFGVTKSDTAFYATFLAVSLAYGMLILFLRSITEKYTGITVYLNISMLLIYGIAVSAAKPYMAATMFPLLMVLAAVADYMSLKSEQILQLIPKFDYTVDISDEDIAALDDTVSFLYEVRQIPEMISVSDYVYTP